MKFNLFVAGFILNTIPLGAFANDENIHEFTEMCKIYTLLLKRPTIGGMLENEAKPADQLEQARTIVEEIGLYNLSTAPQAAIDAIKQKENGKTEGQTDPNIEDMKAKLKQMPKDPKENRKGMAKFLPTDEARRERAHILIGKIFHRAEAVAKELNTTVNSMNSEINRARKHMISAIYGPKAIDKVWEENEKNKKFDWKSFNPTAASFPDANAYDKGCKGDNEGAAGMSLVNDFCCICGYKTGTSSYTPCGSSVNLQSNGADYNGSPEAHGLARWNVVKAGCNQVQNVSSLGEPSPATLHAAIALHKSLLGTNPYLASGPTTTNSVDTQWILGRYVLGSAAVACDGTAQATSNGQGVCVNYKNTITKTGEIQWVLEVRKGAGLLEKAERKDGKIESLLNQLKNMESQAELVYEEALLQGTTGTLAQPGPEAGKPGLEASGSTRGPLTSVESQQGSSSKPVRLASPTAFLLLFLAE